MALIVGWVGLLFPFVILSGTWTLTVGVDETAAPVHVLQPKYCIPVAGSVYWL